MADPFAAYDPIFQAAGEEWNVDPLLLKAMMMQESKGNRRAVGTSGEQGLMQIMPKTQRYLGVTDPFDPVESIWGAAKYMNEALEREGNPEAALLAYNGGFGWRKGYTPERQKYVSAVAGHYKTLQAAQRQQQTAAPQAAAAPPEANPDIDAGTGLVDPAGTLSPPPAPARGGY